MNNDNNTNNSECNNNIRLLVFKHIIGKIAPRLCIMQYASYVQIIDFYVYVNMMLFHFPVKSKMRVLQ